MVFNCGHMVIRLHFIVCIIVYSCVCKQAVGNQTGNTKFTTVNNIHCSCDKGV